MHPFITSSSENSEYKNKYKCLICLSSFNPKDASGSIDLELYKISCKYLHIKDPTAIKTSEKAFLLCSKCYEAAVELADLSKQLEFLQKKVAEFVSLFSADIRHRRIAVETETRNNISNNTSEFNEEIKSAVDFEHHSEDAELLDNENVEFKINAIKNEVSDDDYCDYDNEAVGLLESQEFPDSEDVSPTEITPIPCKTMRSNHRLKNKLSTTDVFDNDELEPPRNYYKRPNITRKHKVNGSAKKRSLKCIFCAKLFKNTHNLSEHLRTHTGEKPFECPICSRKFISLSNMRRHQRLTHQNEKPFRCSLCEETFSLKQNMILHMKTHTQENPYKCTECDFATNRLSSLKSHKIKKHTSNLEIECNINESEAQLEVNCKDEFISVPILKITRLAFEANEDKVVASEVEYEGNHEEYIESLHETVWIRKGPEYSYVLSEGTVSTLKRSPSQAAMKIKPFKAAGKEKSRKVDPIGNSVKAIKSSKGEKHFKCKFCSKKFNKYYLEVHEKSHTGEKPYLCELCAKSFSQKSALVKHNRSVHEMERRFQCSQCDRKYSSKQALGLHSKIHLIPQSFKCDLCPAVFKTLRNVDKHKSLHHSANGQSPESQLTSVSSSEPNSLSNNSENVNRDDDAVKLISKEKFSCLLCQSTFTFKSNLRTHHRLVHKKERPFKCQICEKTFGQKQKLEFHVTCVHNSEKPYKCSECDFSASRPENVRVHEIQKHSTKRCFKCTLCDKEFSMLCTLRKHCKRFHSDSKIKSAQSIRASDLTPNVVKTTACDNTNEMNRATSATTVENRSIIPGPFQNSWENAPMSTNFNPQNETY